MSLLAQADPKQIRRHFNVNVERTARELTGASCLPFYDDAGKKQMIACTRSFGNKLYDLCELESVVATYAANVSEKVRRQQSLVTCLQVYVRTSWFISPDNRYGRSVTMELPHPSADTRVITEVAQQGLREVYREGYAYAKAGVVLTHLIDAHGHTQDLFNEGDSGASQRVMSTLDQINRKMGRGSIRFARTNPEPGWGMRREYLSPAYMTDWSQLLKVRC
ncbi:hypothetical protein LCGC14_0282790 [marine sediment metagenome]|uniref:DUF4113 domain-containing protein n=1 Tax=marine sediment metagenome TaxID=412755 RepID=A0A0F9TVQ8_9ZZZZ